MVVMSLIRHLDSSLVEHEKTTRDIIILLGARQVGKTTILKRLFPQASYLTADNQSTLSVLDRYDITAYQHLILPSTKYLIIDEVHLIKNPGRMAKIFFDQVSDLRLMITGSSAFGIKTKSTESLAGRKIDYYLYPLTVSEYLTQTGIVPDLFFPVLRHLNEKNGFVSNGIYPFDATDITKNVMLYGLYPSLLSRSDKERYLSNLAESAVFKDLLDLSMIENRAAALNLLKLLANQIGGLVNFNEIASKLQVNVRTVRRYIKLFEQSYIIFSVYPYSKAKRKEIGKTPKIYFFDCGLRNALIENFQPVDLRADKGALFENLVMSEVYKANYYGSFGYKMYYWRTTTGSEVDLVLEKNQQLFGLEIKFDTKKMNTAFLNRYPQAKTAILTSENYL